MTRPLVPHIVGGRCPKVVPQVVLTRVGGGLVSPQTLTLGGDKPRPYATLSTFSTASSHLPHRTDRLICPDL